MYVQIKKLIGSNMSMWLLVLLFALQAAWIAIHSNFPLAFDEGYHLGIIQLHATQLNPFLGHLPSSTAQFGALATDPSYLYHYFMSFPYRIIGLFTDNLVLTVICLRLMNIVFFICGLFLFRRVLRHLKVSDALIHLVLLAFALLPLESFTAAQINYDNLLFPLTAAALLFTLEFTKKLKEQQFDARLLLTLACTCLIAAQVKFVFMPIFAAICLFVIVSLFRYKHVSISIGSRRSMAAILTLLVLSAGLFGWRYGYNVVRYGALVPDCGKVMSSQLCESYPVWARNHQLALTHVPHASLTQFKSFMFVWVHIMGNELFTILNAARGGAMEEPSRLLVFGAKILIIAGGVLAIFQWRRIIKTGSPVVLMGLVCAAYVGALWWQNYSDYTRYGIPIAVQGRYLLPVLLILMIVVARAYSLTLKNAPQVKVLLMFVGIFLGLQGAGILTYLKQTDQSWYWNNTAQAKLHSLPEEISFERSRT